MASSQSSGLRNKIWQDIRSRQIDKIKSEIRQLYRSTLADEKPYLSTNPLQQQIREGQQSFHLGINNNKNGLSCELCPINHLQSLEVGLSWRFMRNDGQLCGEHEKFVIKQCVHFYHNNPRFIVDLYTNLNIIEVSLICLRRSLYFVSQVLSLFLVHQREMIELAYEKSLENCQLIRSILDGWAQYRLSQFTQSHSESRSGSVQILEILIKECKKGLVAQFVPVVIKTNWKVIQEMVQSIERGDRLIGLTAVLQILSSIREGNKLSPEIFEKEFLPRMATLILDEIVGRSQLCFALLQTEVLELQIQIIYLCLEIREKSLNLDGHQGAIMRWVSSIAEQVQLGSLSFWAQSIVKNLLDLSRFGRIEQQ